MSARRKLPLVAICGRPNVGKSTLFNRIAGRQTAIIHGQEGITRDRTYASATWGSHPFRVVDTGGIVENPLDPITQKMQDQVWQALEEARVIIFVVDGQTEITRQDEQIRDELFKYGKPVVLAVNKLDNSALEMNRYDFFRMGMGEPYAISSSHNMGIETLMDAVMEHVPALEEMPEEVERLITKVAVVGKPNVGKSSFVNAILNEERTIVTDIPGTTRDAIDIEFRWKDKEYLLIDTAGLRRKARIDEDVERFSVSRSLRAINRADVALVLIDAVEGISEQDKRIFNYINERGTGMVIVWTKWDLVEDKEGRFKSLADDMDFKAPFLKYVPCITISNVTRLRLFKTLELIDRITESAKKRVGTAELNRFVEEISTQYAPPTRRGKPARIYYMTQASVQPTVFVLFANNKALVHWSYLRYIENKLRDRFGFEGIPLRIEVRDDRVDKK